MVIGYGSEIFYVVIGSPLSSCLIRNWSARYERFLFVIIYKFVDYFSFCFRREMYTGSGSSSKVPLQVTTYLIPREMVHGCIFPAVGKYLVCHHMRTPIFLERLAISLIRYDQRNLQNRRQIFLTRPTGAQTKSESVGVRMTSHLFTACFLFKDRTESRKVQPPSN